MARVAWWIETTAADHIAVYKYRYTICYEREEASKTEPKIEEEKNEMISDFSDRILLPLLCAPPSRRETPQQQQAAGSSSVLAVLPPASCLGKRAVVLGSSGWAQPALYSCCCLRRFWLDTTVIYRAFYTGIFKIFGYTSTTRTYVISPVLLYSHSYIKNQAQFPTKNKIIHLLARSTKMIGGRQEADWRPQ